MVNPEVTPVTEDYLTLIWKACEWPDDGRRPRTSDLAAALGVTLSTVSANLKRLAREELIRYEPYGAIELTEEGERIAVEVVRRHRVIETFLVEHLSIPWDEVHEEADLLEHAASDRIIDRMDAILGYPDVDPHGDPIPRTGARTRVSAVVLSACARGTVARVARVSDANPDILRFLSARGIGLGAELKVERAMSTTGLMRVTHDGEAIELSDPIAAAIHVSLDH
ncbi:MAG: metal-dependent transcriptional regulator [Arachnia sp.]